MTEPFTLSLTYSPDNLQRTLISAASIHDLVLLVTDRDHRLGTEGGGLPCKLRALPFDSAPLCSSPTFYQDPKIHVTGSHPQPTDSTPPTSIVHGL